MSAHKTINGYWVISGVVNGYLVTRTYIGYSKKEAIKKFKQETAIC